MFLNKWVLVRNSNTSKSFLSNVSLHCVKRSPLISPYSHTTSNSGKSLERLAINSGEFVSDEIIVGSDSSATYRVSLVNDDPPIDPIYRENVNIQSNADNIIDFTETNPFGEY